MVSTCGKKTATVNKGITGKVILVKYQQIEKTPVLLFYITANSPFPSYRQKDLLLKGTVGSNEMSLDLGSGRLSGTVFRTGRPDGQ